jgi:hypothetical protein
MCGIQSEPVLACGVRRTGIHRVRCHDNNVRMHGLIQLSVAAAAGLYWEGLLQHLPTPSSPVWTSINLLIL